MSFSHKCDQKVLVYKIQCKSCNITIENVQERDRDRTPSDRTPGRPNAGETERRGDSTPGDRTPGDRTPSETERQARRNAKQTVGRGDMNAKYTVDSSR